MMTRSAGLLAILCIAGAVYVGTTIPVVIGALEAGPGHPSMAATAPASAGTTVIADVATPDRRLN